MRKTEDVSFQFDKEEKISENIINSNNNAVHKDKEIIFSKTEKHSLPLILIIPIPPIPWCRRY